MGLARGLVRRVFCKSKSSIGTNDNSHHHRNFGVDKSRWNSVRLYLCGDELNSVLVENDSSSIKSSEASVIQPILREESGDEESFHGDEVVVITDEEESEDRAATLIQSVFRGFMARRRYEEIQSYGSDGGKGVEDASAVNEAASVEVLVDDSTENFSLFEGSGGIQHRVPHKSPSQVYRLKEEWDDSTLSSDTQRLRIQNRLEATTRRERALAYAFSQQLRICTSKKKPTWSESTTEPSTGWSWLERWMATRVPENSAVDDCGSKHIEPIISDRRLTTLIAKKRLDLSFEGKESCGSNDVSVNLEGITLPPSQTPRDGYDQVKNKFKATRSVSRRKTVPEYHRPPGSTKVNKRVSCKETEEKRHKQQQVQAGRMAETKSKDAS